MLQTKYIRSYCRLRSSNQRRRHKMAEGEGTQIRVMEEEEDLISNLPDALLAFIISPLPYTEVVKKSVLCKRWEWLWKHTPNLNFDQRQMLKSLIKENNQNSRLNFYLAVTGQRKVQCYKNSCKSSYVFFTINFRFLIYDCFFQVDRV